MTEDKHIRVEEDGQLLAQATVSPPDQNNQARAQVHVAAGHLPVGTRRKVADAVCDAVSEDNAQRLTATVPVGDAELVERMRDHLTDVELRAAGATSIIEGEIRPS